MRNIVLSWIQRPKSKQGRIGQCHSHGIPRLLRISKFHYHLHKRPHLIPIQRKSNQSTTTNLISSRSNLILSPTYANVYKLDYSLPTLLRAFVICYITHTQSISFPSIHMIKRTNFEAPHPVFPSLLLSFSRRNYSVFMYISPRPLPKKNNLPWTTDTQFYRTQK